MEVFTKYIDFSYIFLYNEVKNGVNNTYLVVDNRDITIYNL